MILELGYSEVCCHMGVAGKRAEILPCEPSGRMAQIYIDGRRFSAPILASEAGIYLHSRVEDWQREVDLFNLVQKEVE